jgi:hypothetical protein
MNKMISMGLQHLARFYRCLIKRAEFANLDLRQKSHKSKMHQKRVELNRNEFSGGGTQNRTGVHGSADMPMI